MASRRGNGEGTISYRKQEERWEAKITVTDPITGKKIRKSHSDKSKAKVIAWRNEMIAKVQTGQYLGEEKITLKEWLEWWLNEFKANRIKQTTHENYQTIIDKHIIPALGDKCLQELKVSDIVRLCNMKMDAGRQDGRNGGLSKTTVNYILSILRMALGDAVKSEKITKNVALSIKKFEQEKPEKQALTNVQMKTFLNATKNDKYFAAYLLEACTGLRRGELLALQWDDINFEARTVRVKQGLVRVKNEDKDKKGNKTKLILTPPKTKSSRRTITVPEEVIEALKRHKLKQKEEKILVGSAYKNLNLVFCNPLGDFLHPCSFVKHYQRLLSRAKLPKISFHELRHTHASLLVDAGESIKVIQDRLGHTTSRMTLDIYSHTSSEMQERAAKRIGEMLKIQAL